MAAESDVAGIGAVYFPVGDGREMTMRIEFRKHIGLPINTRYRIETGLSGGSRFAQQLYLSSFCLFPVARF